MMGEEIIDSRKIYVAPQMRERAMAVKVCVQMVSSYATTQSVLSKEREDADFSMSDFDFE